MKRLVLIALAAALTVLASGTSAQAGCNTAKCLNKKIRTLSTQVTQLQQTVTQQAATIQQTQQGLNTVVNCLAEAPLTQYGDPAGDFGYQFDNNQSPTVEDIIGTTALDVTQPTDTVDGWALFDACNTTTTASASATRSSIAPSSGANLFGGAPRGRP